MYVYCDGAKKTDKGYEFETKPYRPKFLNLQDIATELKNSMETDNEIVPPWVNYIKNGLNVLHSQSEQDFAPPSIDTDKLYMSIGNKDVIEVAHPAPLDNSIKR